MNTHIAQHEEVLPSGMPAGNSGEIPLWDKLAKMGLELYYDPESKNYYFRDLSEGKEYTPMSEKQADAQLQLRGVSGKAERGGMSLRKYILTRAVTQRKVSYAGPMPGCQPGVHRLGNHSLLCTHECVVLQPEPGDCSEILAFIDQRFPSPQDRDRFLAWMYHSYESLRKGAWVPLPVMILVGPTGSYKSFLIELIRFLLGDYPLVRAMRYMSNDTGFNRDLGSCVLLAVDDDFISRRSLALDTIAAKVKTIATGYTHRIEGKAQNAAELPVHWRCIMATNHDPENLRVLPPVRHDTKDKILLLPVTAGRFKYSMVTAEDKETFRNLMRSQLPALMDYLSKRPEMDQYGSKDQRYRVDGWQNPKVLNLLEDISTEITLLDLIDSHFFTSCHAHACAGFAQHAASYIDMTAVEMQTRLLNNEQTRNLGRLLLSTPTACGMYLGRLAKSHPDRVERVPPQNMRMWRIHAPRPPSPD